MPEKSQKRKLRRGPVEGSDLMESSSIPTDENNCISEQDFEDITSKVEIKMPKRLRDTEFCQREILKLIENLTAKADNLANSSPPDTGCPNSRVMTSRTFTFLGGGGVVFCLHFASSTVVVPAGSAILKVLV